MNNQIMKFVEDLSMVVPGDDITIRRSWKERWLPGLYEPWEPWRKTRTIKTQAPDDRLIVFDDPSSLLTKVVVGHPTTLLKLKLRMQKEGWQCC